MKRGLSNWTTSGKNLLTKYRLAGQRLTSAVDGNQKLWKQYARSVQKMLSVRVPKSFQTKGHTATVLERWNLASLKNVHSN
jgi:hypothetical protein